MNKKSEAPKINIAARRWARRCALQALYQWQLSANDLKYIETQFLTEEYIAKMDVPYFTELLHFIPQNIEMIDANFIPYLDRSLDELNPVELAILRISSYELLKRLEIPYRVVINEGVELGKNFGAEESHKYINGVLDKVAHQLRISEIANG
jgi:N utilization substance protein B